MAEIIFPDGSKLSDLLKLTGGTLTGDLTIYKSNPTLNIQASAASSPVLNFKDSSNNIDGQIYTTVANDMVVVAIYGGLYLATAVTNGGNIYLETKDVTRVTVTDTSVNFTVPIQLPDGVDQKISNNAGNMKFTVGTGHKFEFVVL